MFRPFPSNFENSNSALLLISQYSGYYGYEVLYLLDVLKKENVISSETTILVYFQYHK